MLTRRKFNKGTLASIWGLSWIFGNSLTTTISLNDVPVFGITFQRSAGLTTGPALMSGTYTGGLPFPEGQVRLIADNSIIISWTPLQFLVQNNGVWNGRILNVPQSVDFIYKYEVRCRDRHEITKAGVNPFGVGIIIMMDGQSNMEVMSDQPISVPASLSGTGYFDATTGAATTVPVANGVVELLNAVKTTFGVCCSAFNLSVGATSINFLASEAHWIAVNDPVIAALGGDFEVLIWNQGENETAGLGASENSYLSDMIALQGLALSRTGRSIANLPIIYSSLGVITIGGAVNDKWSAVQALLYDMQFVIPGLFYSHTEVDFSRPIDGLHKNGTNCGVDGKRFAQGIAAKYGLAANYPKWFIGAPSVTDATHTSVPLVHVNGTDFTPTSGITGFEVSGDSGATWQSCTGTRANANTITLTHASIAVGPRLLRYLWGEIPDISGCVHDNSVLALPLNYTPYWITCTTGSPTPVPTHQLQIQGINSPGTVNIFQNQRFNGIDADQFLILSLAQSSVQPTSVVITPIDINGTPGTSISLSKTVGVNSEGSIWQNDAAHPLPNGTVNSTVTITWASPPTTTAFIDVWTVPLSQLNSTIATGIGRATSSSIAIVTSAGGFVIVGCASTAPRGTIGGTEIYCQDHTLPNGTTEGTAAAHAAPVSVNASSNITVTGPGSYTVWAAAWR